MREPFDPANRQKHGLGLADGARILDDPYFLEVLTVRVGDGEERFKLNGDLHLAASRTAVLFGPEKP